MNSNNATSATPWALSRLVRRGLIAVVLALAALLLALGAPAAQGDPTKVMASENPVFVPYSTDTKTFQLTVNLEAWQPLATLEPSLGPGSKVVTEYLEA